MIKLKKKTGRTNLYNRIMQFPVQPNDTLQNFLTEMFFYKTKIYLTDVNGRKRPTFAQTQRK